MALEGGEGSASPPGHSLTSGKTQYPLYRRLGGVQDQSGQVQKISPPAGTRSPDRPARSQSLYRLRYPALNRVTGNYYYSWFQIFAMFYMLYAFFWVIPRCLNFMCRRFRTLCLFHLHRRCERVLKHPHIKFRHRGITHEKEWNEELSVHVILINYQLMLY
jgi:hypothetical protein